MAETQQLVVNGTALSNNDPDLVITLDSHPAVQISSKQASTITYSFVTDVDTVQVYNLNLTFTYKGVLTKVVPLTFTHNPKPVPIVITDTPITAAMWGHGNNLPFKVTLDGADVTNQLSNITLVPNAYIKADRTIADKKLWSVENSTPVASSVLTEFNFNFTYEGKVRSLSGKGTFNIPAYDGVDMWITPFTADDPTFSNLRIKVGQTVRVYTMPKFRGIDSYDDSVVFSKPALNDLSNGLVTFALETGHWSYGRPVLIRGDKVGTGKPKLSFLLSNVDPGYTPEVVNKTLAYWSPNVEVWDDILEATTTDTLVHAKKGEDVTFNLALKFSGADLATNAAGVAISFGPAGVLSFKSATATTVTATVLKDVTYTSTTAVTVTATYQTKTASVPLNVKVLNEVLDVVLDTNVTNGGTNDLFSLTPTVTYNGVVQPLDNSIQPVTIVVSHAPQLTMLNRNNNKLNFKVVDARTSPQSYVVTITVTVNGISKAVTFTHNYKVKPTLVTTPVSAAALSQGAAPFSFQVNGSTVTPTIDSVSIAASTYVQLTGTVGAWKVIKADDTQKVENVGYTINITHDGVSYSYTPTIAFTIATLGSTVTAAVVISVADMVLNKESQVVFSLAQTLNGSAVTLDPVFESTAVTGTATFVSIVPHPDNAGQFILTVKGKGTIGAFTLNTRLHNRVGGSLDGTLTYPFTVNFTTAKKSESTITATAVGSTALTPAQQNTLTVALKYGNNNVVVGATPQSVVITSTPNSTAVIPSYRTTLVPVSGQPGQYTVDLDAGHKAGSASIAMTVLVDGATHIVDNSVTYTNAGTPVNSTPLTIELDNLNDKVSAIEFSLAQSRFGTTDHNFTGATFKSMTVTGAAKAVGTPTAAGAGKFSVNVTAKGTTGDITVSGIVVDTAANEYPFSFVISAVVVTVVTTTSAPLDVQIWDKGTTVPFTVKAGATDVTSQIKNVSFVASDYIGVSGTGWEVLKADVDAVVKTVEYTFNLDVDGKTRTLTHTGVFNIAGSDSIELKATVTGTITGDIVANTGNLSVSMTYRRQPVTTGITVDASTVVPASITLGTAAMNAGKLVIPWTAVAPGTTALSLVVKAPAGTTNGGTVTLSVPISLIEYTVVATVVNPTLNAPGVGRTNFLLKDKYGAVINNATVDSISIIASPASKSVMSGFNGTMNNDQANVPGQYYFNVYVDKTPGDILVTPRIAIPGKTNKITLPTMTFHSNGTPVIATPTPSSIKGVLDQETVITIVATQSTYSAANAAAIGTITIDSVTGPGSAVGTITATATPGTYELRLKSTGAVGAVTVNATYQVTEAGKTGIPTPFSFNVAFTA